MTDAIPARLPDRNFGIMGCPFTRGSSASAGGLDGLCGGEFTSPNGGAKRPLQLTRYPEFAPPLCFLNRGVARFSQMHRYGLSLPAANSPKVSRYGRSPSP